MILEKHCQIGAALYLTWKRTNKYGDYNVEKTPLTPEEWLIYCKSIMLKTTSKLSGNLNRSVDDLKYFW